ncbi:MAG: ribose-phosphate pyrophosphokinase [Oscillospiraceae bacterium]|jgi:ribose-phosphate pyrophosphokinase|nr:ribose-phosphate pyrophosphokinase [Oscillospiraceae bacterium]
MDIHGKDIRVFCGNSTREVSRQIAQGLGLSLGNAIVSRFSDGEISVSINESVRGSDVFVIQSTCYPVNDNLMELLIMIDAFHRASAARITAVMPYFGYARQDRKAKSRDPISAKLVANLITAAKTDRLLTMDLHASQIQGFFDIPVDNLLGVPVLLPYFLEKFKNRKENLAIVSPDIGSVKRARKFASALNAPLAIIDKRRQRANESEVMNIIGDVRGRSCVIVDDLVDTAGTLVHAAEAIVDKGGAKEVYACATHAVLSGRAVEKIKNSPIKEMVFLDSVPLPEEKNISKFTVLPIAPVFAEAIERIYDNQPISILFN